MGEYCYPVFFKLSALFLCCFYWAYQLVAIAEGMLVVVLIVRKCDPVCLENQ